MDKDNEGWGGLNVEGGGAWGKVKTLQGLKGE